MAPSDEYEWTIRARRRYGFTSKHFEHIKEVNATGAGRSIAAVRHAEKVQQVREWDWLLTLPKHNSGDSGVAAVLSADGQKQWNAPHTPDFFFGGGAHGAYK